MWAAFLGWIAENRIGDLSSIAGVLISIVGFVLTVYNVRRSKKAAELARDAAQSAKNSIQTFEAVVDLSGVIGLLDEIKRAHRTRQWAVLPDRYAALRRTLINVRKSRELSDQQAAVLQAAIANLSDMENAVEKALPDVPPDLHTKFNPRISQNIDDLAGVLADLKYAETGA